MKANLQMLATMERSELRRVVSGKRAERDFSIAVREYAEGQGWKVHYMMVSAAKTASGWKGLGPGGFPDLFMVRDERAVAAELKTETGSTTVEQRAWLSAFEKTPVEQFVWKPRDASEILEKLR